ncbi:MAG: type II secretion system F family protein [Acetatifactor sp.]
MSLISIRTVLRISAGMVSLMTFAMLLLLRRTEGCERAVLKAYHEWTGFLKKTKESGSWYRHCQGWLTRNGAVFHYGKWVEPIRFLTLCILLGLAGLLAGMPVSTFWGWMFFSLFFMLPFLLLVYLNKRDNERMLPELKLVYHALEIQTRAGVYVTDALAECYGSVRERRLRQALLELAGDIVMKADINASLEKLQKKFDNRYIDSLCIIILQALESGQAIELLRDIGEQIKDMEEAVLEQKKASLDRRITFCQLGVLTVVLGVALYACVIYMFSAASGF